MGPDIARRARRATDTALCNINDLVPRGVQRMLKEQSTRYLMNTLASGHQLTTEPGSDRGYMPPKYEVELMKFL